MFTESLTDPRCPGSKVARFRKQEFRSWFDPGNWKSADLEELNPVETGELVLGRFVNSCLFLEITVPPNKARSRRRGTENVTPVFRGYVMLGEFRSAP